MKKSYLFFIAVLTVLVLSVSCEQSLFEASEMEASSSDSLQSNTPVSGSGFDDEDTLACRILSEEQIELILSNTEEQLQLKSLSIGNSFYPKDKGFLYSTKYVTVPASGSTVLEFPRTSFSPNYDFYAQLSGIGTYAKFEVKYLSGNKYVPVSDNRSSPATLGEYIGFNTSGMAGIKRNIPLGVKTIQVAVTATPGSKLTLTFWRKSLKQKMPWISQYKAGCGSDGFDNAYCGHTSLLMAYGFLINTTPKVSLIYPSTACGKANTPLTISDWLAKNLSKSGFCSYCGSGTYNPVWLRDCAKSFFKLQAEAWSSNSNDGANISMKEKSVAPLREQLTMGNAILVQTYIKNNPSSGITHWMVLTDWTEDSSGKITLYFHDPGRKLESDGKYAAYSLEKFTTCWYSKACAQRTVVIYK